MGSSSFEDDSDVVLALLADKATNGSVTRPRLCARKRRSGPNGEEFEFRPRVVNLGVDSYGSPITTLVIDWLSADEAAASPTQPDDKWTKGLRMLRQVLMTLVPDCGSDQRPYPDGPIVRAVDIELVRAEFYKGYPATGDEKAKSEVRRKAFNRAMLNARERGLVGTRDIGTITYVWLATPGAG